MKYIFLIRKIAFSSLFLISLATVFSVLYQGYYYGGDNGSFYYPYLKSLANPSLYPRDLLIVTWKSVYFAILWKVLAILLKVFPIELLVFVFHVVFRFLFFLALYFLAREVFRRKEIAFLALALWFIPKPTIGFEVFYNEFVQSEVALPLLLFSFVFLFKNKYFLSAFLAGISFYIHPPMAGYITMCFILSLIYKKKIRQCLLYSATVFLVASPILWHTFLFTQGQAGYGKEWIELTRIRSPHHSFPLLWPKTVWVPFLFFVFTLLISLKYVPRGFFKNMARIYFSLTTLGAFMILGFVFSEVIPAPVVIITVPFHTSGIFAILATLPISYAVYSFLAHESPQKQAGGAFFLVFGFFNNFDLLFHKAEPMLILIGLIIFLLFKRLGKNVSKMNSYSKIYIIGIILLLIWIPIMFVKDVMRYDSHTASWIEVQKWAKTHTHTDDLFIVPLYESGFRLFSERSILGDWKDGSGGYLSPQYLNEWWRRMTEFGLDKKHYSDPYQRNAYLHLAAEKVTHIAQKYRAQYFVTDSRARYPFPEKYRNRDFVVYSVEQ